ncbi:hypothetical protein P0D88_16800 [Paraburkholderia sp. RL18-103-BIB-C]|uniref:hypothetical protein n=1 Tax=Paraburkholderia sp. RL18-103-BIB-C TaxID=3031637 RepID=UPI0038B8ED9D
MIHELSDNDIHDGWTYFASWRKTRNYLLLFDALGKLNAAERKWMTARGAAVPLRREWQVLRRCVMRGLERLRNPLLAARTPAQTEHAIYRGGKRATLARVDQLQVRAIDLALASSGSTAVDYDKALTTLAGWGISAKRSSLITRASQLGLSRRRKPTPASQIGRARQPAQSPKLVHIAPGRTRHAGTRY